MERECAFPARFLSLGAWFPSVSLRPHILPAAIVFFTVLSVASAQAYNEPETWPQPLQDKAAKFQPAYQLIQKKDYEKALPILQQNIREYPEAETIDYEYVWGFLCLAQLGRFQEMEEYYAVIRQRGYAGEVRDKVTDMNRDWALRIMDARDALEKRLDEPGARQTLRKLAALEVAHRVPDRKQISPFERCYDAHRRRKTFSIASSNPDSPHPWYISLSTDDLAAARKWHPPDPPAISIGLATAIAHKEIAQRKARDVAFSSVTMRQFDSDPRHREFPDIWYYIVEFSSMRPALRFAESTSIYILMDGTVLQPRPGQFQPAYEDE